MRALPHNWGWTRCRWPARWCRPSRPSSRRNKKPVDAGVLSVTMIHAGEATNVIPDTCELQGTVRTFTLEVLDLIEQRMQEIAEHTCAAFGMRCEFSFHRNYPPTINSAPEAEFARHGDGRHRGRRQRGLAQEPTMGAEDFAFMLQAKPGAYCFIANGDGLHREMGHGGGPCMLHNPSYDFNDDLIPLGATYWVRLARGLAQQAGTVSDLRRGLFGHLRAGAASSSWRPPQRPVWRSSPMHPLAGRDGETLAMDVALAAHRMPATCWWCPAGATASRGFAAAVCRWRPAG
jgi:hypothetical protein